MSPPVPFRKVYGPPAILSTITLCGLLSALLGDGIWDMASWCALTIPLVAIALKYGRSKRTKLGK